MHVNPLVLQSQLFFARNGATIDSVTVSSSVKPDTSPTSNWTMFARVNDLMPNVKIEEEPIMAPSPGRRERVDIITTSTILDYDITLIDVSELMLEMLFAADGGTTGITADYVPLSGTGAVKGWFKFQNYDQDNVLRNVCDVWARATISDAKFDDKTVKAKLKLQVLFNALNTGTLTLG